MKGCALLARAVGFVAIPVELRRLFRYLTHFADAIFANAYIFKQSRDTCIKCPIRPYSG
jgi:hypothetical protein